MRAIVWDGEISVRDDVAVRPPGPREVLVRVHRAGLCHSDVSVVDGTIPFPTPCVLGHEGAGVVEAVGNAVTAVAPGDHVVLTTLGNCGQCAACDRGRPTQCRTPVSAMADRFTVGGTQAFQFANAGVFSERTVVHETQAVVIDPAVPFDVACLIGCALVTGAGAVFNRAGVKPGDKVVVIGAGGIGLCVVQAARIAAASRIVVADLNPAKEPVARQFGATDFVDTSEEPDLLAAVGGLGLVDGADHVFECVGSTSLIRSAIDMLAWGGNCVLLGVPGRDAEAAFAVSTMYNDKSILGCRYGTTRPHHDIPMLAGLYLDGRLLLDEMVSRSYELDDFGEAVDDLARGGLNRGVFVIA